jgi:hypothetical protein
MTVEGRIAGEAVFNYNFTTYETVEFNMAPFRVLAKTSLTAVFSLEGDGYMGSFITGYKRKRPDGSIEDVGTFTNAVYDDNMTSIKYTYGQFHAKSGWVMIILEFWI